MGELHKQYQSIQKSRLTPKDRGREALLLAIKLFIERRTTAGSPPNAKDEGYATGFARHLIYGAPLSKVRVPQDIKDDVYTAVVAACRETHYKLPQPKKQGKCRKKR